MRMAARAMMVAATLAVSLPASAGMIHIGDVGNVGDQSGGVFGPGGFSPAVASISVNGGAAYSSVYAGMFVLDFDNLATPAGDWVRFLSFCIDPHVYLTPYDNPYTAMSLAGAGLGATAATDLARLWALYRPSVTNSATAAAFQLAVWELAYDAGSYSLTAGLFRTGSVNVAGAFTTAQAWITAVQTSSAAGATKLGLLVGNPNNNLSARQRLLTTVAVPEPGTLTLLGLGLLGAGLGWRRRG